MRSDYCLGISIVYRHNRRVTIAELQGDFSIYLCRRGSASRFPSCGIFILMYEHTLPLFPTSRPNKHFRLHTCLNSYIHSVLFFQPIVRLNTFLSSLGRDRITNRPTFILQGIWRPNAREALPSKSPETPYRCLCSTRSGIWKSLHH